MFNLLFVFFSKLPFIVLSAYLEILMGRVIITIDEIIAGRGLVSNKDTVPPSLDVLCGKGIKYGENDEVTVNNGFGLNFNEDGKLSVVPAELAGHGLVPGDDAQIDIDTTADPSQEYKFRVVTNNQFMMDGYRLVFSTTYTTFIVHRNQAGIVIGFEEGEVIVEQQPLNIDGYGYGNSPVAITPKSNVPEKPSFYKS